MKVAASIHAMTNSHYYSPCALNTHRSETMGAFSFVAIMSKPVNCIQGNKSQITRCWNREERSTMLIPNEPLGRRIARLRKERLLTQVKLAELAGLWPRYLSDVETGRKNPRMDTIARIAAGLRVSIGELVGHI